MNDMEVTITRACIAGVVLIFLSCAGCQSIQNWQDDLSMTKMVEHGANPLQARCAIKGSVNNECIVLASRSTP